MLWVRPSSGMSTNTWNSTMNVPMESNDIKWYQIDINMNNMMYCKRNNHERNASHRRQVSASSITAICCPSESGPALPVEQLAVGSSRFGTQLMFWLASQSSPHFFGQSNGKLRNFESRYFDILWRVSLMKEGWTYSTDFVDLAGHDLVTDPPSACCRDKRYNKQRI